MVTETKDQERAKEQARAQLNSIIDMVKRLEHCKDCTGEDCNLTDAEIYAGINLFFEEGKSKATAEERTEYHDEEQARQQIEEDPLSVQVRTDWHTPGEHEEAAEYEILLCTGGPACRIIGDLDDYQQPDTAHIEYQDWFTPWVRYSNTTSEEDEALLTYAQQFYFSS